MTAKEAEGGINFAKWLHNVIYTIASIRKRCGNPGLLLVLIAYILKHSHNPTTAIRICYKHSQCPNDNSGVF